MRKVGEAYIESREKRAFDVIGASLLGISAAPLAIGATAAMCIERRQLDPIFRQRRLGRYSMPFMAYKLRTMVQQDEEGISETFGPCDPRASRLEQLVRQIGIDELPQVANILRGELSLVGVRPQIPVVLEQRQAVDGKLFDDWYWWYERNPGLFGAGQAYAHEIGYYTEDNDVVVRRLLEADIAAHESASLRTDIAAVVSQPLAIVRSTLSQLIPTKRRTVETAPE